MKKSVMMACITSLAMATTACATIDRDQNTITASRPMVQQISGQLSYRERIALPPNARVEIIVNDITDGPDSELVLSRTKSTVSRGAPPIPFRIDVSKRNVSRGPLYGLRAFIYAPDGRLLFRTTGPFLLDQNVSELDVGTIYLSMADASDPGAQSVLGIQDGEWRVTQLGFDVAPRETAPTMTFGLDGSFHGSTSCNNFSSTYKLNGAAITFSPIAVTMRACEATLMEQERRFLEVLNSVNRASLDADGRLLLEGANGLRMNAERNR